MGRLGNTLMRGTQRCCSEAVISTAAFALPPAPTSGLRNSGCCRPRLTIEAATSTIKPSRRPATTLRIIKRPSVTKCTAHVGVEPSPTVVKLPVVKQRKPGQLAGLSLFFVLEGEHTGG